MEVSWLDWPEPAHGVILTNVFNKPFEGLFGPHFGW